MHRGYVKLWRKTMDTSYYNDPLATHLANHLILKANWQDKTTTFNGQRITVLRGQVLTGRKALSKETGINESTIRHKLDLLSNVGFLTSTKTNKFTIITIIKYEEYQSDEEKGTAIRPTSDQQKTTSKELNRIKKNKDLALGTIPVPLELASKQPLSPETQKQDNEEKPSNPTLSGAGFDAKRYIREVFKPMYFENTKNPYPCEWGKDVKLLKMIWDSYEGKVDMEKLTRKFFGYWREKKDNKFEKYVYGKAPDIQTMYYLRATIDLWKSNYQDTSQLN